MDLDPGSWGGLELVLKIGPVKTSTGHQFEKAFHYFFLHFEGVFMTKRSALMSSGTLVDPGGI